MRPTEKTKVCDLLQERLGRKPEKHEIANAETDVGLLIVILFDKMNILEDEVELLKKNQK